MPNLTLISSAPRLSKPGKIPQPNHIVQKPAPKAPGVNFLNGMNSNQAAFNDATRLPPQYDMPNPGNGPQFMDHIHSHVQNQNGMASSNPSMSSNPDMPQPGFDNVNASMASDGASSSRLRLGSQVHNGMGLPTGLSDVVDHMGSIGGVGNPASLHDGTGGSVEGMPNGGYSLSYDNQKHLINYIREKLT